MSDDEPRRGSGGAFAPVVIGCSVLGLLVTCVGPTLGAGLAYRAFGRSVTRAVRAVPSDPSPPPGLEPARPPGEGGPHMPTPPGAPPLVARVRLELVVTDVAGTALVTPGSTCTLEVEHDPGRVGVACHAELRCGGTALYGGEEQGFYDCEASPGADGLRYGLDDAASAVDGDPRFGVSDEHVEVSDDDGPLGTFRIAFARPGATASP